MLHAVAARLYPFILALVPLACGTEGINLGGQDAGAREAGTGDAVSDVTPPGTCLEDDLGNSSQERSFRMTGAVELPGLALCPGTEDWFRLDAQHAASFAVSACADVGASELDFAAFREELGMLYRHENCASSGAQLACVGTCTIEAPGIYFFRLSAARDVRYSLGVTYKAPVGTTTQVPPSLDATATFPPGTAQDLTVCAPFALWYKLELVTPSTVTLESTLPYAGYYLDFTLTDENQQNVDYWPQGPGKTRHEVALGPGRFQLRIRSALSGCREFSLSVTSVAK
jgi:hypothetical protein